MISYEWSQILKVLKFLAYFESRPGASPQSGLRGGRSLCEYCTNKIVN